MINTCLLAAKLTPKPAPSKTKPIQKKESSSEEESSDDEVENTKSKNGKFLLEEIANLYTLFIIYCS